jgi:3',5'-cyclic AMP phosphodiesterase CpdA
MRIALIADSHLSPRAPECIANWQAARVAVERLGIDLTVHLGDISLDGQNDSKDLTFAAARVREWPTEMRCVPGNHDLGDGSGEAPLNQRLLAAYRGLFGPDRWWVNAGAWRLVGINAQLLGTGSPEEAEQWRWLEELASAPQTPMPTMLFLHRPAAPRPGDPKVLGRYVVERARHRLLRGPLHPTLRAVVSGHTHQTLDATEDGVRHLWIPSSAFVMPDWMQTRVGEKVVGLGLLELEGGSLRFDLWCPEGMLRHDLSLMPVFRAAAAPSVMGPRSTSSRNASSRETSGELAPN